ncbi:ester cyclase [Shimia sediminis]|uniref:ester cyclase n=1 Tax=Shimia sediminis TaxID=2497945 RepID=UPI000F8E36B3|nr:ester cyclase [Shimia sediminis]
MDDRKSILAEFIQKTWNDGDVSAVPDFLARRYTIHSDPGDPWEGQTLDIPGFQDRLVKSRAAAPDQRFECVDMIAEGDRIAMTWRWSGTHLGDLPGLPASGAPIRMTGITVYYFQGNRLCGHWQNADRLSVYQQILAAGQGA